MCSIGQTFDQSFQMVDLGPRGLKGPFETKLRQKFTYGASVHIVACTDFEVGINIRDDTPSNILMHLVPRPFSNDFVINSFLKNGWGIEERVAEIPIKTGIRFSLTIVYEKEGYRIFIDGKEITFYKHRSDNIATRVQLTDHCHLYKLYYFTHVM